MHLFRAFFSLIFVSLVWHPTVTALTEDSAGNTPFCTTCVSDPVQILAEQVVQTPTVTLVIAPPSVVVTTTAGTGVTSSGTSHSSGGSGMASISPFTANNSSLPAEISQLPTTATRTATPSKSGGDSLKMRSPLHSVLGVYTIAFTLFLLPIPTTNPLELLILITTALTGWTFLYLDPLLHFLQTPKPQLQALATSFPLGLHYYISERWHTYQLIRRRNSRPHYPPHLVTNPPRADSLPAKIRLGAWWKSDVLKSLKSHANLRDYFLTPQNFVLEKYHPTDTRVRTPPQQRVVVGRKRHGEDDIFSSDEELDTSPLATKMFAVARGAGGGGVAVAAGVPGRSGDSKKTVVDAGVSEREKVSGFISWDALKRDLGAVETGGGGGDGEEVAGGIVRTETEGSGGSWEREALGAAV